jgi:hypothetical protein
MSSGIRGERACWCKLADDRLNCAPVAGVAASLFHTRIVGTATRRRREPLGLTQARLAQMSGLSRRTLVELENGSLSGLGFSRVAQVR